MPQAGPRVFFQRPLASAMLTCFFAGGLYGWSALIAPLQDQFVLSTADTGLAFSLAIVSFTLAVIAVPYVTGGVPSCYQIALFGLFGAGFVLLTMHASNYPLFLLWFSGGFGAMSGAIYIVALAIAAASSTKTVATALMVASFGAGGAVFGPLWRVLSAAGWGLDVLVFLAVGLVASSLLAWGSRAVVPANDPAAARTADTERAGAMSKRLILIWLTFAFGSYTGLMVLGMAAKMMDAVGLSLSLSGVTLAGIAILNTAGRLSAAFVKSRLGLSGCLAVSFVMTVVGLVSVLLNFPILLACGLVLVAGGYGLVASTVPMITQTAFAPQHFQRRFAVIFSAWGVAGFSAPWIAGKLFDLSGTFAPALLSALLSCTCFAISARLLIVEIDGADSER